MNFLNNILLFGSCMGTNAASTASDENAQSGGSSWWVIVIYIVIFGAIIYFLMIRPQRKERKKQEATMSSLEPGDSILTTSGFYGTLVAVNGDTVIVEFGNNKNCRIPMSKQAISQVEKAGSVSGAAAAPAADSTNNRKFLGRNKKAEAEEAQARAEAAQAKAEEAGAQAAEAVSEAAAEAADAVNDAAEDK